MQNKTNVYKPKQQKHFSNKADEKSKKEKQNYSNNYQIKCFQFISRAIWRKDIRWNGKSHPSFDGRNIIRTKIMCYGKIKENQKTCWMRNVFFVHDNELEICESTHTFQLLRNIAWNRNRWRRKEQNPNSIRDFPKKTRKETNKCSIQLKL